MTPRQVCTMLALAVAVIGKTAPATAQVATGTVSGTVRDVTGRAIPGAAVTLTNERRGASLSPAVTSFTGDYLFRNVPAGTYTIEVTMAGFATAKRTGVAVSAGDPVSLQPLTLEVGGAVRFVPVTERRASSRRSPTASGCPASSAAACARQRSSIPAPSTGG